MSLRIMSPTVKIVKYWSDSNPQIYFQHLSARLGGKTYTSMSMHVNVCVLEYVEGETRDFHNLR